MYGATPLKSAALTCSFIGYLPKELGACVLYSGI